MMKKMFTLLAIATLLCFGCSEKYDDTELRNSINSLEERISAMETVMKAYKGNLFIQSVEGITNGYTITFSDGSQATIVNGKDGANGKDGVDGKDGIDGNPGTDGETLIESIVIGEFEVTFHLTDGNSLSIPLYSTLSITFEGSDTLAMSANSTRDINYVVKSVTDCAVVEVTSSADIKAKVITDDKSGLTGKIQVTTGAAIDEYSKVIVFVSNGEKVIMRSITFEEAGLKVEDNAVKNASAEGGEVALEFLTNVECNVVIPEEAQSWISIVPETRAMEKRSITLKLEPNKGHNRSAVIKVEAIDGSLKLEYKVEQSGDLGAEIDPEAVPDDEIWYTTSDKNIIKLTSDISGEPDAAFNCNVVSNVYQNGYGRIKFDAPVTEIKKRSFAYKMNLESVYLPSSIEKIGLETFFYCSDLKEVYINSNNLSIEKNEITANPFFYCDKLQRFNGSNASDDGRCLIVDNSLYSFAPDGISEYTIPQGVKTIEANAFSKAKLRTIRIPEGVERIEHAAFSGGSYSDTHIESSLEYVYLPSTLNFVHGYAFIYNKNIKAFYGNNQFVSDDNMALMIYNYKGEKCLVAFASGAGLTEYTIPEGVAGIENYAFYYATTLKKLNFPDSFYMRGGSAFEGTTNIETITGKYVLDDNRSMVIDNTLVMLAGGNLQKYTTPPGVSVLEYQVLGYNNDVTEYVISDEVIEVESYGYMFNFCPNLETITISARMQYLGYDPFNNRIWGNPKLKTVYCRAVIPPLVYYNDKFDLSQYKFDDLKIYVPKESLDAYQNSTAWRHYKKYLMAYDYGDLSEFYPDYYISTDYSQDGKVTTLQTATEGNGIDIVLMGDAYSDRQIADGTYEADMEYIYSHLFTEEPYKSFKHLFNVYYVNAVSESEGYYGNGYTALGGFFGDGTLVGGEDAICFEYAQQAIGDKRMDEALVVVAMNSDDYAGTCYMYSTSTTEDYGSGPSVAYFPRGGNASTFAQLLHHEACGHGFAKLADEYAYEEMGVVPSSKAEQTRTQQTNWGWWKNVDFTNDLSSIRWKNFLSDSRYANEGLGAYEGGLTYWTGVWRPTENSIMRHNTGGFNAPSREAIYYRIHKLAYGDSWEYNYEDFVQYDAINRKTTLATYGTPYKPANYKPLHPPVVRNKSWRDAK